MSSSTLGVDWSGRGEGRDYSLSLAPRVSLGQIPCGCGTGLGERDTTEVTPVRAACLRSGSQRTPKPSGTLTPSRVSPAPRVRPVGSPVAPYPFPWVLAPTRRSQARLRCFLAVRPLLKAAVCSLVRREGSTLLRGLGVRFRDVGVQRERCVPGSCGPANSRARFQRAEPSTGLALSSGCQMPGPVPELSVHYLPRHARTRKSRSDSRPARGGSGARTCTPHASPDFPFLPAHPRSEPPPPKLERTSAPPPTPTASSSEEARPTCEVAPPAPGT